MSAPSARWHRRPRDEARPIYVGVAFDPPPDYAGIAAAAGNAFGRVLKDPAEVEEGIAEALEVLRRDRRSAVLDCWLAPL